MLDATRGIMIRNASELKKFVKDHDGATPLDLVAAINISLQLENNSQITGKHHRLNAGRMLNECKRKVEAEGCNDWWQWAKGKFDRSQGDIRKLMAIARADDPEAAEEEEREKARTGMAKTRANVSANPVDNILKLVRALTDQQRDQLHEALRGEWKW